MKSDKLKPGQLLIATDTFVGIAGYGWSSSRIEIEPGDRFLLLEVMQTRKAQRLGPVGSYDVPVWRTALLLKTGVVVYSTWYGGPFESENQHFAELVT